MNDQKPSSEPLGFLTPVGRLLLVATMLIAAGGFYFFVVFVNDSLPSGSYPVAFLVIPGLLGAVAFFVIATFVLRLFGIRVWRVSDVEDDKAE